MAEPFETRAFETRASGTASPVAVPEAASGPRARMRKMLLTTAMDMMARGITPSIAELAEAADVSRATAYRYFATQGELVSAEPKALMPAVRRPGPVRKTAGIGVAAKKVEKLAKERAAQAAAISPVDKPAAKVAAKPIPVAPAVPRAARPPTSSARRKASR